MSAVIEPAPIVVDVSEAIIAPLNANLVRFLVYLFPHVK